MNRIQDMGNNLIKKSIIDSQKMSKEHAIQGIYKILDKRQIYIRTKFHITQSTDIFLNNKKYTIISLVKISDGYAINLDKDVEKEGEFIQYAFYKFYNNIRFQYKGSECGVYSIYFQKQLLKGIRFREIIDNIIDDDVINNQRNIYFRK